MTGETALIRLTKGDVICRQAGDLPEPLRLSLHPNIVTQLGEPLSQQFPAFAKAFPATADVMQRQFSPLVLIYKPRPSSGKYAVRGIWKGENLNLVVPVHSELKPPDRPDFELDHEMLPPRWRELYRYFDSFGIQSDKSVGRLPLGLPVAYSSRMDAERYQQVISIYLSHLKINPSMVADFCDRIGQMHPYPNGHTGIVQCWCANLRGDSLWISFPDKEQHVYRVEDGKFGDAQCLDDPGSVLDSYMASTVSGDKAARFCSAVGG